jgi:hypothetical protein
VIVNPRTYSHYSNDLSAELLNDLIKFSNAPSMYQNTMIGIGHFLGNILNTKVSPLSKCLVASTAEDADFLAKGVTDSLANSHETFTAVFWNNHYSIPGGSVAPIVHKYLQAGFEDADSLIVVKSIISGSCVVRTNILALIERLNLNKIYIVAPIMHTESENALRSEFPPDIFNLFDFVYLAEDNEKDEFGEIKPGIGGQIYQLLGMQDQPVKTGFVPEVVKQLVGI